MPSVRAKYETEGYSKPMIDMLMKGWRNNTQKQYNVYLNKWNLFCIKKKWCPQERNIKHCVDFLLHLYNSKNSYSAINTARSALSCIFDVPPIGEHSVIKRFMRSVFNTRPSKPRYTKIWDVSIGLKYLERNLRLGIKNYKN